jgi:hypothetical protein
MTPIQASAADSNNVVILRQVFAHCRRLGYEVKPGEIVDVAELNRACPQL